MSRSTRVLAPVVLVLLLVAGATVARCDLEPRTAMQLASVGDLPALGAVAEAAAAGQARHDAEAIAAGVVARAEGARRAEVARQVEADRQRQAAAVRTSRSAPAVVGEPASALDDAFWRRLGPGCESSTGRGGNGGGYFQFSPDTAAKVGYHAGLSYEAQRGLAKKWLAMIGGAGGSKSGWPHCWWVARAGG